MKKIYFLSVFLISTIACFAQINTAAIDKIITDEMIRQNLPGIAVGIHYNGRNMTKGYGYLDFDHRKRITDKTVFRWASISKTLTAVALLQLDDKTKAKDFSIEDRVIDHYPHWTAKIWDDVTRARQKYGSQYPKSYKNTPDKARKEKITIKHLLSHNSGINHYSRGKKDTKGEYPDKPASEYKVNSYNANATVDLFRIAKLDFDPGKDFLYTTYGYNLLGAVIDKKTGSYPKWVEQNIKNKLGMSSLRVATGSRTGFAKPKDGIIKEQISNSKISVLPGGGWESNIQDLLKFGVGLTGNRLLVNVGEKLCVREQNSPNPFDGYRRGVKDCRHEGASNYSFYHGGLHNNLKTLLWVSSKKNLVIAFMIPADYADNINILRRIVEELNVASFRYTTLPNDKCVKNRMSSTNKKYFGLYLKGNGVIVRRGYPTNGFNKEYNFLRKNGYYLKDIEVYTKDNKLLWDGIFVKGSGSYALWRNFNTTDFNKKWNEMRSKGYRLYDLETYTTGRTRYWAGLFKKERGKAALWRNFSTSGFGKKREEMAKKGYKLIDIEVYTNSKGALTWSGVWIAGKDGLLNRNFSETDFMKLNTRRNRAGYKLIDVETYTYKGKRYWAGIWEKSSSPQPRIKLLKYCDFMNAHDTYSKNGYQLIDFEIYN